MRSRIQSPIVWTTNTQTLSVFLYVDGVSVFPIGLSPKVLGALATHPCYAVYTPSAGSHVFEWRAQAGAGSLTTNASRVNLTVFEIEELVRQNSVNNATSG